MDDAMKDKMMEFYRGEYAVWVESQTLCSGGEGGQRQPDEVLRARRQVTYIKIVVVATSSVCM